MKRIACCITPPGRSAIAIVDAKGFESLSELDRFFKPKFRSSIVDFEFNRIAFGTWTNDSGSQEELIVVPRSKNHVEIQCHGGRAAVEAIMGSLGVIQFRAIRDDDQRDGCEPNTGYASEVSRAISNARTIQSADRLLVHANRTLVKCVHEILGRVESDLEAVVTELEELSDSFEFGKFLTKPVEVVFSGKPNVGKSSLSNAILGFERSIVLDQPGTTRDVVSAVTSINGWSFEVSDTAGLRTSEDEVEMTGVELAIGRIRAADVWIWVSSAEVVVEKLASDEVKLSDKDWIEEEANSYAVGLRRPDLIVINKMDLISRKQNEQLNSRFPTAVLTNAIETGSVERLMQAIADSKFANLPSSSSPLLFTTRQFDLVSRASKALQSNDISLATKFLTELIQ